MKEQIYQLLDSVKKPARYIGGEWNSIVKPEADDLIRFAFCFPDLYEIGMSYMGLQIIYYLLNDMEEVACERVFAPDADMEEALRQAGLPLFTLESRKALNQMDIVGFTLQYELSYTNILNMMELGGIPMRSCERGEGDPLVIAGGPCAFNAEPLADFLDVILLGDSEEVLPELCRRYGLWKASGESRESFLRSISSLPGLYVPAFYEARYDEAGLFAGHVKLWEPAPKPVPKAVLKDLSQVDYPRVSLVPFIEVVHDRCVVELFRGCSRGCRFCQAGMVYRPVRERQPAAVTEVAKAQLASSGQQELSLLSLSTSDYSRFEPLVSGLLEDCRQMQVNLSLPSLRLDSFSFDVMEETQGARKGGLTFAPEAGSQRLRDVINKNISEEEILTALKQAVQRGWQSVKLYFMIGLPTERDEDLEGIVDLVEKIRATAEEMRAGGKRRFRVTVSVSNFVPKPFTPFAWCAQDSPEELQRKQFFLKDRLRPLRGVSFRYHDPFSSRLETLLGRGDRRLGQLLFQAQQAGCTFDAWTEGLKRQIWEQLLQEHGIDDDHPALTAIPLQAPLPWDIVDIGVSKDYLLSEYHRALAGETTPDCRLSCNECGLSGLADCFVGVE